MATLREIRNKIRSVGNIKKITQAMEMVAGSRLRKAQVSAEQSRPYAKKLKEILLTLVQATDNFSHSLIEKRAVKKVGVIVVSSDKGLCGSYNQKVFSAAENFLKSYPGDQAELFIFGRKGAEHFVHKKWPVIVQKKDWGGKISFTEIKEVAGIAMSRFLTEEIDEVWLVYTHYVSMITRHVVVEKFLNLEKPAVDGVESSGPTLFEPDSDDILSDLLPRFCTNVIQTMLHEAYAAELAARVMSMRAATKNAQELIESLTLVRNKVRQAGITREMLEIISCAESLNS